MFFQICKTFYTNNVGCLDECPGFSFLYNEDEGGLDDKKHKKSSHCEQQMLLNPVKPGKKKKKKKIRILK